MTNAFFSLRVLCALLFVVAAWTARAEETRPSDNSPVRDTALKGLGFLAREGDRWMNEKNCNACHHQPFLLWTHREARRRGIPIDEKQFDEYLDWATERSKDTKAGPEVLAFLKLAMPDRPWPELTKLIAELQQPDGAWKPGGQFASMQRRDLQEATENSARVFLLALGSQDADAAVAEAAREKAAAFLEKSTPSKAVETLVYRMFYARRYGTPTEEAEIRAQILQRQHADGGWGWMIGEDQSDPLATGEALYVLQHIPDASSADAIGRGLHWLVSQQREDGSWPIDITRISKMDRSAPEKSKSFKQAAEIYTFWGSAWATLSLLEGLPEANLR